MRMIGLNINGDYPFCPKKEETIDPLSKNCDVVKHVWSSLEINCAPDKSDLSLLIGEHILNYKCWYNKVFHNLLGKLITIDWVT